MWGNYCLYHKGVELRGASPELWFALSDAELNLSGPTVCRRWIHLAHNPEKRTKFIKSLFKKILGDFCSSCTRENSDFLQNNLKLRSCLYV